MIDEILDDDDTGIEPVDPTPLDITIGKYMKELRSKNDNNKSQESLINSYTIDISFIEFKLLNNYFIKCYKEKDQEIEVSSYGFIDKGGRFYFSGSLDQHSLWFNSKFKDDDNSFMFQNNMTVDARNQLTVIFHIASKNKLSEEEFENIVTNIKKLAFNNSEYKGKCIKVKLRDGSFYGIEIIDVQNSSNELILTKIQKTYTEKFIESVARGQQRRYLLNGPPGCGKAQPLHCKILTPNGWVTMGEIEIGDEVLTPSGKISKVIGVYPQGMKDTFEVSTKDGRSTEACGEHLWRIYNILENKDNYLGEISTLHIKEILDTTNNSVKFDNVSNFLTYNKYVDFNYYDKKQFLLDNSTTSIEKNGFVQEFDDIKQAEDIREIVWSIGGNANLTSFKKDNQIKYIVNFIIPLADEDGNIQPIKNEFSNIEFIGQKECQCIMIDDESHLYITDDYIVTHNTETIREIARRLIPNSTFIIPDFTTSEDLTSILQACQIFDNSVLVMDDFDLLIGTRSNGSYTRFLNEFLSFFDGMNKNKISLLASTNSKEFVDKAAERPGRFNLTLDYGYLETDQVIKVCNIHLPEEWRVKEVYDSLTGTLKGKKMQVTGAFIANLSENIKEMSNGDDSWNLQNTIELIIESYKGFYDSQIANNNESIGFRN
jgi:hypothetical protein